MVIFPAVTDMPGSYMHSHSHRHSFRSAAHGPKGPHECEIAAKRAIQEWRESSKGPDSLMCSRNKSSYAVNLNRITDRESAQTASCCGPFKDGQS